jgi:hypothetical protein
MRWRCWECELETEIIHNHHVVPKIRGGTKTVPLCEVCHSKAHHRDKNMNTSALTKEGLRKAKERGVKLGNPRPRASLQRAHRSINKNKIEFNNKILPLINSAIESGLTSARGIAKYLNEKGLKGRRGGRFAADTVIRILKSVDAYPIEKP